MQYIPRISKNLLLNVLNLTPTIVSKLGFQFEINTNNETIKKQITEAVRERKTDETGRNNSYNNSLNNTLNDFIENNISDEYIYNDVDLYHEGDE